VNVLKPLLEAGASQREIERVTGIDRKTIRSYQRKFAEGAGDPLGLPPTLRLDFPHPGHRPLWLRGP
jgi:hypothetical protein